MKPIILCCTLALSAPQIALADSSVEGVISDQITAFQADDFATAFGFASPGIQRLFGSVGNFARMVRNGYPMVWRPGDVRFLDGTGTQGRHQQDVLITDQAGRPHVLRYHMVQIDGDWRIDGVTLLAQPDINA